MAESLLAPAPEVDQAVIDAGYSEDFEGFAQCHANTAPETPPVFQGVKKEEALQETPVAPESKGEETSGNQCQTEPLPVPQAEEESKELASSRAAVGNALADARRVADGSGMLQKPEPQVSEPEPQAPLPSVLEISSDNAHLSKGPFLARLHQFSETLHRHLDARGMFLIDSEGKILFDEVENPKLVQVARTLAKASHPARMQSVGSEVVGNLHVKIGTNSTLEVVPLHSSYGLLILGVVFPAPLGAQRVQQVADLLSQTVEPTS